MRNLSNDERKVLRIRKKLKKVNFNRYRVSVFRSSKNISAQIIDDKNGLTLISASSKNKEFLNKKIKKIDASILLGELLAKKALGKKITRVYFDRGKYKYHGRIRVFAESLRKNGLSF